jgi:hypothetical protein
MVAGKSSLIFAWVVAQALAQDKPLPKFEDFKVAEVFKGTPAQPILRTAHQRLYRTTIRAAARKGPTFAGHYAFAAAGCGSDCSINALIDEKSGEVFDQPFQWISFPLTLQYPDAGIDPPVEAYRIDSRLLIVHGCPEEKNCGTYYYEWTGSRFNLLRRLPALSR